MADEQHNIQFEEITPWGTQGGDTGQSSRLKLKRNFDKIRAWIDSLSLTELKKYFLSRTEDDTAQGFIRFIKGLQVGEYFTPGLLGEGGVFRKEADGTTYLEADKLYIRIKAIFDNVEIRDYKHSAGNRIASPAGAKCCRVEYINSNGNVTTNVANAVKFRCYFRGSDGEDEVRNNFVVGDQAYCHVTSVDTKDDDPNSKSLNMKHYWRLVVGRNATNVLTENGEHWIDLSNKATETLTIDGSTYTHAGYQSGSDVPSAQDDIIQLGNVNDTDRMGAIIEFVTGADAPSYQIFQDINDFNLNGKNYIGLGYSTQTGRAYMNVYGDAYIGDPNGSTFIRYNQGNKKLEIKAEVSLQSTFGGNTLDEYIRENTWTKEQIENLFTDEFNDIDTAIENIQKQVDGSIETWFYDGVPTLSNLPASNWTTTDERINHLGDLYYENITGYAYRFKNTGTEEHPQFEWGKISDQDVTKALADAAKAQDTADHKRRVFVRQPLASEAYDVGDLWVNATYSGDGVSYANDVLRCNTAKAENVAFSIAHWEKASKYTDDTRVNDFITNTYAPFVTNIQGQVDGKAETWRQATDPASAWTTNADKIIHIGDLWMDISANGGKNTYIYVDKGSGANPRYDWEAQDVPQAVFDDIDGKSTIFANAVNTPPSDYKKGDMWILPSSATINGVAYKIGDVLNASQDSTTYNAAHWSKKVRYTDDTALNDFVNNTYNSFVSDIQSQVDGKAETWYQATDPSTNWTSTDLKNQHKGDIWHNTSSTTIAGVESGRDAIWNGTAWKMSDVPQSVYDTIDGKADIFVSKPSTYNVNDLWIIESTISDTDIPTGCKKGDIVISSTKRTNSYNKADWKKKDRYTDDSAFNGYINAILNGSGSSGDAATVAAAQKAIKDALVGETVVNGGLILSSLIAMRKYKGTGDKSDIANYNTWAGISGVRKDTETGTGWKGYGIAAWYGGAMTDHEVSTSATDYAKSLFRFDGSGYLASGNISWDKNGIVTIANVYSNVNGQSVEWSGTSLQYMNNISSSLPLTYQSGTAFFDPKISFTNLSIMGKTVATQEWVSDNYISINFFSRLFKAYNGNTLVNANDVTSTIDNIKAMFGFWTEQYISALGQNSGGGGGIVLAEPLQSINSAGLGVPQSAGVGLVWNGSSWVYGTIGTGSGTVTQVKVGTTAYSPSSGVVSLPAYPSDYWKTGDSRTANTVLAAPNGSAGAASFRALVAADIPNLAASKITSGTFAAARIPDLSGTYLALAGGTMAGGITMGTTSSAFNTKGILFGTDGAAGRIGGSTTLGVYAAGTLYLRPDSATSASDKGIVIGSSTLTYNGTDIALVTSNVASATKLNTSRTLWGQSFNGTANVSGDISNTGNITPSATAAKNLGSSTLMYEYGYIRCINTQSGYDLRIGAGGEQYIQISSSSGNVGISSTLSVTGATTLTANGGITIPSGKTLKIGDAVLSWDSTNSAIKITKGLYSETFISALGAGSGGSGGGGVGDVTWDLLANNSDTRQIALSHLTTALSGYLSSIPTASSSVLGGVKVGTTLAISSGVLNQKSGIATAGTYPKVTVDTYGRVTEGANLAASDIPSLAASKITSGTFAAARIPVATADAIGGIKVGTNLSIEDGVLSATDTKYSNGTAAILTAGTNTTNRVWSAKILKDEMSTYLPLSGGTMTGTLTVETAGTNNYNQGIRINRTATNKWALLFIGKSGDDTEGTGTSTAGDGAWLIGTPASSNSLIFNLNTASASNGLCLKGHGDTDIVWNNNTIWHAGNDGSGSGLDADLLDGLHASSFGRKYSHTLAYGKTVKITFSTYYQTIVTGRGSSSAGNSIILVGTGYSTANNYWRALYKGSTVSWCTQSDARGIEIKNTYTSGNLYITVLALYGTVTFAEVDDLSGTAVTDSMAMISSNVASATKLHTARTIWGQSFDGSANVSGNMTGVGTISASGDIGVTKSSGATNVFVSNNKGKIALQTDTNRGLWDYTSSKWLITTNGTNTWLPHGTVAIDGSAQTTYKLYVNGDVGVSGTFYATGNVSSNGNANFKGTLDVDGGWIQVESSGEPYLAFHIPNVNWGNIRLKSDGQFYFYKEFAASTLATVNVGNLYSNGSVTALSDARHKTVIKDTEIQVDDIAKMPAVVYRWNDGRKDNGLHVGSIAQDWQRILPEVVMRDGNKEGTLSMQYGVAALVSSIITARKVVDHERRISELERENKELKLKLNIA